MTVEQAQVLASLLAGFVLLALVVTLAGVSVALYRRNSEPPRFGGQS